MVVVSTAPAAAAALVVVFVAWFAILGMGAIVHVNMTMQGQADVSPRPFDDVPPLRRDR